MAKKTKKPKISNPVAKYCRQFNKATVERDKTKYYRKEKHNKSDYYAFFMICAPLLDF